MAARTLYMMCVGEGGMDPNYFKHELTYAEADDFLAGLHRKYRAGWEQARLVSDVTAMCTGNKGGTGIKFGWEREKKSNSPEPCSHEIERMAAEARRLEDELNKRDAR